MNTGRFAGDDFSPQEELDEESDDEYDVNEDSEVPAASKKLDVLKNDGGALGFRGQTLQDSNQAGETDEDLEEEDDDKEKG